MPRLFIPLTLLIALSSAGCGEDFAPLNELEGHTRVLGLRTTPAAPAPGDEVLLEALTWAPKGQTTTLRWSWCPLPNEDSSCAITHDDFQATLGVDVPAFDLGDAKTANFSQTIPYNVLQALCDGSLPALRVADCGRGFPIQIRLEASTDAETEIAIKTLFLPLEASDTPNHNPVIPDMLTVTHGDDTFTLHTDSTTPLHANASLTLHFPVEEEASEIYQTALESLETREQLTLSWYIEGGHTEFKRTAWFPEDNTLEAVQTNTWSTPTARTDTHLYLVMRDGRGGISWQSFSLDLIDAP